MSMKVTKEQFIGVTYDELLAENAKLRKYVAWLEKWALDHASFGLSADVQFELDMARRDLGVEVDE